MKRHLKQPKASATDRRKDTGPLPKEGQSRWRMRFQRMDDWFERRTHLQSWGLAVVFTAVLLVMSFALASFVLDPPPLQTAEQDTAWMNQNGCTDMNAARIVAQELEASRA